MMAEDKFYVDGELYLSLELVAQVYQVQVLWLQEVLAVGLLGSGVGAGSSICIAALQLDRLASIVRMNRILGLDLETLQVALLEE